MSDKQCSPSGADCAPGHVCAVNPARPCMTFACNATARAISAAPCAKPGVCALADSRAVSAAVQTDLRTVVVELNKPSRPFQASCDRVFSPATLSLMGGANAMCAAEGARLTVRLASTATLLPPANLTLLGAPPLQDDATGAPFTGAVALAACAADCAEPFAVIAGPETVPKPCQGAGGASSFSSSSDGDVVFDASRSFDPSGRPLASVQWSVVAPATPAARDAALVAAVARQANQTRLALGAADLAAIAAGDHALRVTVASVFGGSAAATKQLRVVASGAAPVIDLADAGATRRYSRGEGLRLSAAVSACDGAAVTFSWAGDDAETRSVPWAALASAPRTDRPTLMLPGPVRARHGDAHVLTLSAAVQGGGPPATASVRVVAEGSPLVAALKGPSDYRVSSVALLSASDSFDPDGES